MPSFSDSIFLFVLALLLFGPKKLPVLARELGKWMGEFRRASNEFKMQMEEELRLSEQEERRKQVAAMEAAAPATPPIEEPEHPHRDGFRVYEPDTAEDAFDYASPIAYEMENSALEPLPIATSGELSIMPPATGLPIAQDRGDRVPEGALEPFHDEELSSEHSTSTASMHESPESATHA